MLARLIKLEKYTELEVDSSIVADKIVWNHFLEDNTHLGIDFQENILYIMA